MRGQDVRKKNVVGPLGYTIWLLGALLEATVVVCSLVRGPLRRYFTLNLYMVYVGPG